MAVVRTTSSNMVLLKELFLNHRLSCFSSTSLHPVRTTTLPCICLTAVQFPHRQISFSPVRCAAAAPDDNKVSARLSQVQKLLQEADEGASAAGNEPPPPKITLDNVTMNFARSGGPGGQNVNKVAKPQWKAAIDFKWIRENKDAVARNIKNRNSTANLELVLGLYEQMLTLQKEVERLRGERNIVANKMKGKLEPSERQKLIEEGKNLKEGLTTLEEDLLNLTDELQQEAQCIPNMTHPDVPIGDEDCSTVRKMVGCPRVFSFPVKDHLQLGKELDLFDFDSAAEASGSKFYYLKNEAVMLEMALINWTLSEVMKRGFTPLMTPEIVRSSVVEKCGFQPRGDNTQVYSLEGSDQCLIGTAEIPVGGIHMDSILPEMRLPLKYVAFSHCFRTEAGAAGTATRGLYRVHQFSKVEMFIFCRPEESESYHGELIEIEEYLFSSLGFHYKMLDIASGDLGAPTYRKFDVEAWMPGLGRYGEISSASNCTDYQSRRLGIRYRPSEPTSVNPKKGKGNLAPTQFVHTLNATACAVPRMILCLLENYQQEDGSVVIPEPLRPFMGGLELIVPKSIKG